MTEREKHKLEAGLEKTESCWLWRRGHDGRGYGLVHIGGRDRKVHRVIYEAFFGEIPEGREIHHKCNNKGCANPAHLEPVTRSEHLKRTYDTKGRVESCKRGHPYDETNTYVWRGTRCCRACNLYYTRKRRATRRTA